MTPLKISPELATVIFVIDQKMREYYRYFLENTANEEMKRLDKELLDELKDEDDGNQIPHP